MRDLLDRIAQCLEYPRSDSAASAREAATAVVSGQEITFARERTAASLLALHDWLREAAPGTAEERYTGLFDLSPTCTLHIGHHLFGESYERGAFLSGLAGELSRAGLDPKGEIGDFLPLLLRLIGRLPSDEDRTILFEEVLLPGFAKMEEALADSNDPWSEILRSLPGLLPELRASAKEVALHA